MVVPRLNTISMVLPALESHVPIHPRYSLAFYRIEPNGRGTGIANHFAIPGRFLALGLETCADVLRGMHRRILRTASRNAKDVRNGSNSKFSPGPARLPKEMKRAQRRQRKSTRR